MANNTKELMEELYNEFRGLPNEHPIVRNNTINDAFPVAILKLEYGKQLGIDVSASNIDVVSSYIVAPPDSGIDMFVEIEDGEEYYYHIIQVKYSELNESEIRDCYLKMKETIKDYLKDSSLVEPTLKKVIDNTNFAKTWEQNCQYIVYHRGNVKEGQLIKNKVSVATTMDLDVILQSYNNPCAGNELRVPYDELLSDTYNNYIIYDVDSDSDRAVLCSIRGYDLAELCDKYYSTAQGRNILFGQNLRESLAKKSKTSKEMIETIEKEPNRFWHYNNGITIIVETINTCKDKDTGNDKIQLKNFSIINGAQTTSTLREFYALARSKHDDESLEKLKKVYVMARLMEITDDKEFGNKIAVYNNSQNAISSRDMVANNIEQNELHNRFWDSDGNAPHIFIQTRNGATKPAYPRCEKHQSTTNEELAQLAFAAFLQEPFSAKDKKAKLFTKDNTKDEDVLINENYDKIFRYYPDEESGIKQGILFKKNKYEIDEVLFIKYLYRNARKENKKRLEKQIDAAITKVSQHEEQGELEEAKKLMDRVKIYQRNKEINNTCMFYCITLYYTLKEEFGLGQEGIFDYSKFYGTGSEYSNKIIDYFGEKFLTKTIEIVAEVLGSEGNVGNWVRRSSSQSDFINKLNEKIALSSEYESMYNTFVEEYKTVKVD